MSLATYESANPMLHVKRDIEYSFRYFSFGYQFLVVKTVVPLKVIGYLWPI